MSITAAAALVFVIISSRTGQPIDMNALATELATRDVVFIGEEHDNSVGHRVQLRVIEALHGKICPFEVALRNKRHPTLGRLAPTQYMLNLVCWRG